MCSASCVLLVIGVSSRRRHTHCALVTGVQTCALPISPTFPKAPCRVRRLLRHDGEVMLGGFGFPVLLNLSAGLDIAVVGVFPWDRRDLRQVAEYGVPLHDQERPLARDRKSTRLNSSH